MAVLAAGMALSWALGGSRFISIFALSLMYGLPVAAVTGLPVAILLGLALRRVASQSAHVLAFFLVFTVLVFLALTLIYPPVTAQTLPFAIFVGAAAAVGRTSIWKLARVG